MAFKMLSQMSGTELIRKRTKTIINYQKHNADEAEEIRAIKLKYNIRRQASLNVIEHIKSEINKRAES